MVDNDESRAAQDDEGTEVFELDAMREAADARDLEEIIASVAKDYPLDDDEQKVGKSAVSKVCTCVLRSKSSLLTVGVFNLAQGSSEASLSLADNSRRPQN